MKKGRSSFNFKINCDTSQIKQLIQNYIDANGFKTQEKNGETFFKATDVMIGDKYFNYSLVGDNLTIYAWIKGAWGEIGIEQEGLAGGNILIMNYRNSLNTLFQEIEKINVQNNNGGNMDNNMGYNPQNDSNNNQFTNTFQNETTKKQEKLCEIGFWLSILGLLCSIFGVAFGAIIYIMDFYFASQGLKTRKRGKAIATIVLSVISLIIVIFEIVASVYMS